MNGNVRECSYDPSADLIPVNYGDRDGTDEMYLEVKFREVWFQTYCKETGVDGCIDASQLSVTPMGDRCLVTSTASVSIGGVLQSRMSAARFIEPGDSDGIQSTVTMAVGRALKEAGFGSVNARKVETGPFYPVDAGFRMVRNAETPQEFVRTPAPVAAQNPAPSRPAPEPPKRPVTAFVPKTMDDYENIPLSDAYQCVCPVGRHLGKSVSEIMGEDPHAVEWFSEKYKIPTSGTPESIDEKTRFKAACRRVTEEMKAA